MGSATTTAAMPTTQFIARHGFRRWYERELIRGHAHLVMVLLSAVAAMGAAEAFGQQQGLQRLVPVVCLLVAAGLGVWALRRYLFHLSLAEALAHQAECPHCRTYARWQADGPAVDEPGNLRLPVRCRACGGRWTIRW
jgi:hypothetical protein